jgi:hypothetical protein
MYNLSRSPAQKTRKQVIHLESRGLLIMRKFYFAGLFSGFIGGILGAYILVQVSRPGSSVHPPVEAIARQQEVVSARRIRLIDASGSARAELAFSQSGAPGLFFYDAKGRNRLELGLYPPAESEYPYVVLNDTQLRAAGIFRLYGGRETPVVVLKNEGRDRSIYGLNASSTEPFLVHYSSNGTKTSVFGDF